jgi:hypothetical protein
MGSPFGKSPMSDGIAPDGASAHLDASTSSTSEDSGLVDKYGIPTSIQHECQNEFTAVWHFIHQLKAPQPNLRQPKRPFTHICLVCAEDLKTKDTTAISWQSCLQRQANSSNAALHMLRDHEDHPFSVKAAKAKQKANMTKIQAHDAAVSTAESAAAKPKKQRTIEETMVVSDDHIRIMTTRSLLSLGLPHTTLENGELLNLVRRLSLQPSLSLPARETFYGFAYADFQSFVDLASKYLQSEFELALRLPFLAMLHDLWTNASTVNVVGVTAMFIDFKWRLVTLFLLAALNPSGHAAKSVADLVKLEVNTRYGFDMNAYARFTVSDTTGSARNVSDHFENTDQVDCLMHKLSLCLLYGLGLKENTRQDSTCTVTPGGKFEEGLRVVKMLRDLATFFNTPMRLQKLMQLKEVYNLPPVNVAIDAKTRVGYAVTLLRRSVYNYFAFAKYFDTATSTEQATWVNTADADCELIIESSDESTSAI